MFAFKFIATSQKKTAEEVKQIIKFFRTELYPEDINLELGNGNAISVGYRFPNKFRIDVLYDGKDVATRIKPCFLRDVNITYNPSALRQCIRMVTSKRLKCLLHSKKQKHYQEKILMMTMNLEVDSNAELF